MNKDGLKFEAAVIVQQKCNAEDNERHTAENTAAAGPSHGGLLALSRIIFRRGIRRRNCSACGWNWGYSSSRSDVAIHGSHCRRETNDADDHQNYWPRLPKRETAAGLLEEEQYAHGDDYRGSHQAADGTAAAIATNAVTHLCWPPTTFPAPILARVLLRDAIRRGVPACFGTSTRQRQSESKARTALSDKTETTRNCSRETGRRRQSE